jgi:hypothetical protein
MSGEESEDSSPEDLLPDGEPQDVPEVPFDPSLRPAVEPPNEAFRATHQLFEAPRLIGEADELATPEELSDDAEEEREPPPEDRAAAPIEPTLDPDKKLPEWRRFRLPPIPEPDDSQLEAEISAKFDISLLLQQIRAGGA